MASREDLESLAFEIVSEGIGCSRDEYLAALRRFDLTPVEIDGAIVGVVLKSGPEIHIGVMPNSAKGWSNRRFYRGHIKPLIALYGSAVTTVRKSNAAGLSFCKRLGFEESGESDDLIFMICKRTI